MASITKDAAFDIVPTRLAIKAMRDSGYKNAAYAIAELVDNAVQAGATKVEILCKEKDDLVRQRKRTRVQEIAVIDNGAGMNASILRTSLQFGAGERLDDRTGIGRFGMGLPNSSISQARRVDVWTWQDGPESAIHSYLDLGEIESGEHREVPEPQKRAIPAEWLRYSAGTEKSGTLVVWSELDKCEWKTAHAIFRNSEFTVGRIYRRFLANRRVRIRMAAFIGGAPAVHFDEDARPNDPLYLMRDTSCPAPWDTEPMFEDYGAPHEIKCAIGTEVHSIRIRYSLAKKAARGGHNPGGLPHGKHASNNIGVSVMRADRELELQTGGWTIGYNPVERWWGVEVDFPPALDEIFGVTNNKQHARTLAEFAVVDLDQIATREGFDSEQALIDAWGEDQDPRLALVRVKQNIESNLATIRKSLTVQSARTRTRGKRRHEEPDSAEMRGTKATLARQEEGHVGTSDQEEKLSIDVRQAGIAQGLEEKGLDREEAVERARSVISDQRKFEFYEVDLASPEFFTVTLKAGAILIGLNTSHPAYEHLVALFEPPDDVMDVSALRARMQRSYEGLKLLLEAWARYEDELTDGRKKEQAQLARFDWGRVARDFFRDD